MSTILLDGSTRVAWVAATDGIADITAPTVAELTAGIDLSRKITPDGLTITPSTGNVDNSNLASRFTTNQVGRASYSASMTIQRQTQANDAIAQALDFGNEGFLVARYGIDVDTDWAAGQEVEVYPAQCGKASKPQSGPEQIWTYEVPIMITDDPETAATVAA